MVYAGMDDMCGWSMPMRVRVSGLNSWLEFFSLKITGGAHAPPAGHTQLSRVNPTAGGRRQSLTDEWSGYCTRERAYVVLGRVGGWVGGRGCYVDTGRPLRHDFASFRDGYDPACPRPAAAAAAVALQTGRMRISAVSAAT